MLLACPQTPTILNKLPLSCMLHIVVSKVLVMFDCDV